jgi:hypothetical protein
MTLKQVSAHMHWVSERIEGYLEPGTMVILVVHSSEPERRLAYISDWTKAETIAHLRELADRMESGEIGEMTGR